MTTITRIAVLITWFAIPTAMAGENPHCVTEDEFPLIITQCDDGTVTITNARNNTASVCRKGEICQEISL